MKSKYLLTIADPSQLEGLFQGPFMKGYREPRIAVVGRSNVGKSSLLNSLLGSPLAQTSKQPGKTRAIHLYLWSEGKKILVDLPGYGYAQQSKAERQKWEKLITRYLDQDSCLEQVLLLLDARHGPTPLDQDAMEFLSLKSIPVIFVFTKADTLKTQTLKIKRQEQATNALKNSGIERQSIFWVSSQAKVGFKPLVSRLLGGI